MFAIHLTNILEAKYSWAEKPTWENVKEMSFINSIVLDKSEIFMSKRNICSTVKVRLVF